MLQFFLVSVPQPSTSSNFQKYQRELKNLSLKIGQDPNIVKRAAILTAYSLRSELRNCSYYLSTINEAIKTSIMDFRPNPSVLTEFLDRCFITIIYVDECNKIQGQQGWAKVGVACSATNIFAHLLLRRLEIQVPENQEYLSKLT